MHTVRMTTNNVITRPSSAELAEGDTTTDLANHMRKRTALHSSLRVSLSRGVSMRTEMHMYHLFSKCAQTGLESSRDVYDNTTLLTEFNVAPASSALFIHREQIYQEI